MWGVFYEILLVPQNIVMDVNNVMSAIFISSIDLWPIFEYFFGLGKQMGDLVLVENCYVMGLMFLLDPFTSVIMVGDHLNEADV